MVGNGNAAALRELGRQILARSGPEAEAPSLQEVQEQLRALAGLDYSRLVRRLFDRRQLLKICDEFSVVSPKLNVEVIRERELKRLAQIARELGTEFSASRFSHDERSGLRGFYVRQGNGIKRPLICLNTAGHPVVMVSAFWHEVGHHLTSRMFDDRKGEIRLSLTSSYHLHLNDPLETAADVLPTLIAYPRPAAARLFARSLRDGTVPNIAGLVARLRSHLRAISHFEFSEEFSATQNLRYLTAMIHSGKLRWAVLSEFDI